MPPMPECQLIELPPHIDSCYLNTGKTVHYYRRDLYQIGHGHTGETLCEMTGTLLDAPFIASCKRCKKELPKYLANGKKRTDERKNER